MKAATLLLYYLVKFAELTFLFSWTILILVSGIWFLNRITDQEEMDEDGKDSQCLVLVPICIVLVIFNLLYNNLLINLRFLAKMRSMTFGLCIFDCVNWTTCYCILLKPCRD